MVPSDDEEAPPALGIGEEFNEDDVDTSKLQKYFDKPVPVTIITGYLGSGKTTLVNYILTADHGEIHGAWRTPYCVTATLGGPCRLPHCRHHERVWRDPGH